MGLRGCSEQEAFDDLVGAVHDTGVGPGALARALVGLVGGSDASLPHRSEAMQRWGHVMANRAQDGRLTLHGVDDVSGAGRDQLTGPTVPVLLAKLS